jgi:hypothetical protein
MPGRNFAVLESDLPLRRYQPVRVEGAGIVLMLIEKYGISRHNNPVVGCFPPYEAAQLGKVWRFHA